MPPGDDGLLGLGVAGEVDDFQPIQKRPGQLVHHVGGGDEHGLDRSKGVSQVVVHELGVLLGVQHLQKHRGRVALEMLVAPELVDLVEHEHGVVDPAALYLLQYAPGHGPDVGAPVAAELGLVAHAAQGEAHELAPQGLGHGAAYGGLARARRAREAQNRPARRAQAGAPPHGPRHGGLKFVHVQRLAQVMLRPPAQGVHGVVHRGVARDHDDLRLGPVAAHMVKERHAVHGAHAQVRDHDVELLVAHELGGLLAAARQARLVALALQEQADVLARDGLVVHHQHAALGPVAQGLHGQYSATRSLTLDSP